MAEKFGLEEAIALQEHRLRALRRQAVRGERYVIGQLKRAEREYFTCKRRLARMRRRTYHHGWKTSGLHEIEPAVRD